MITAVKTDEALMSGLMAGDLDAAAPLFKRYQVPVFHFFIRLGFGAAESEDMVQTVFERVIRYRASYRPEHSFRSWLYRIARNVRTDFYQKRFVFDGVSAESVAHFPPEQSPEQSFLQQEMQQQLDQALRALSGDQLEILLLTRFQGLRYAEVADLLGCTEGAVKVKVFRALQQLRTNYFDLENK